MPEPSNDTESEPEPPAVVPVPTERPDATKPEAEPPVIAAQPPEKPADADDMKMLPDPRSADLPDAKMPAEEVACRERLRALGVEFEGHQAESNPDIGCSIPYPIMLKSLGKSIAIGPATELNCPMAEAAARFAANVIQPAAKDEFGANLKSINQASAFVCRPRHGTRKLSEHAFGNALDIASFTLSDGRKIEVGPTPPEKDGKFLNAVRKAACGPFKTVLGPGADADHALHLHLDLEPRRHGGTFCQ
ncbi:extensin-like domain-containing protein [Mesorhizobium sp. ArgA1]